MKHHERDTGEHTRTLPDSGAVPLNALHRGEHGVVATLAAGSGLLSRMACLGFTPGARVTILQNFGRGPLIACVRDARVALGRSEAGHILVSREPA